MKAAVHHTHGASDVLVLAELPDPQPGPGEVLIQVAACGLNHLDLLQRRGPALIPGFSLPHAAGMDVAGTIVALGSPELPVSIGDRVLVNPALGCGTCAACRSGSDGFCPDGGVIGGNRPGGYAELVLAPAGNVFPIPEAVSFVDAAVIPTAWMTAWHALTATTTLRAGETVLIHAGASGVSTAAIQLAKAGGTTVIATAGSARKMEYAQRLGADVVINSSTDDITGAVRAATGGRGVDLVIDHVGPAVWDASIYAMAPRARMVFFGNTSGARASFDLVYAYHFGLQLLGSDPYDAIEFPAMLEAYWQSGFVTPIDSTFTLAEAGAAQERLEARLALGKIVLVP
jgi:NADPH:quinone reductase-like Zn-dependent oxidoreductase